MKKLEIALTDWTSECADGCCTDYGTTIKVNGKVLENNNSDRTTILEKVLEHLGYEVEITEDYLEE